MIATLAIAVFVCLGSVSSYPELRQALSGGDAGRVGMTRNRIKRSAGTCDSAYQGLEGHTMKMTDQRQAQQQDIGPHIQDILNLHNDARRNVNPTGTDLVELEWNDCLAVVAAKWSKQCPQGHDSDRHEPSLPGVHVGQNVAWGYWSWTGAIDAWHAEKSMYKFGEDPDSYLGRGNWRKIGHYTQMVSNTTFLVGCGFSLCGRSHHYVCNYAPSQSSTAFPYTKGPAANACPYNRVNNLCSCGGKICLNRGVLNVADCSCTCADGFSGDICNQRGSGEGLNCAEPDRAACSQVPCQRWRFPLEACPHTCGGCPGAVIPVDNCPEDMWDCVDYEPWECQYYKSLPRDCPHLCNTC